MSWLFLTKMKDTSRSSSSTGRADHRTCINHNFFSRHRTRRKQGGQEEVLLSQASWDRNLYDDNWQWFNIKLQAWNSYLESPEWGTTTKQTEFKHSQPWFCPASAPLPGEPPAFQHLLMISLISLQKFLDLCLFSTRFFSVDFYDFGKYCCFIGIKSFIMSPFNFLI